MTLRVGSLAYATDSGLGLLAKSFYDAGVVTDVVVVRHAHFRTHDDWYPGAEHVPVRGGLPDAAVRLLGRVDAVLFFETPFWWELIPRARDRGVRTALMPMYECMPARLPHEPDAFLNPSPLDQRYYPSGQFLPVPVEDEVRGWWRRRGEARAFVHNAGHGGLNNRNGTGVLLDAMRHVRSPLRLVIRTQKPLQWSVADPRVEVRVGTVPRRELYAEGEVFVFPEKFNGLSLPLQEAHAAGMAVVCGDRFPLNTWLPRESLIPVAGYERDRVSPRCHEFDSAVIRPEDVAATMDAWYGRDVRHLSDAGRAWAGENSWERLRPRYLEALACRTPSNPPASS